MNRFKKLLVLIALASAAMLLSAAVLAAPVMYPPTGPVRVIQTQAPTATPASPAQPCDFMRADLAGSNAAVVERLLSAWGFKYFKPDGKWTEEDAYELKLFQRWAGRKLTGAFDLSTRKSLMLAWQDWGESKITRDKLPLEGRYIGINPGHQKKGNYDTERESPETGSALKAKVTSGTQGVSSRVPEYVVTLQVGLKLRDKLEAMGARVLMARTTHEVNISNGERARAMNTAGVHVYLSLHCDGNNNHSIAGIHTIMPAKRGYQAGDVLTRSQKFAALIQAESLKGTGAIDKGYYARSDLSSLNWAKMPTCLIEMGYMTNVAEDKKLVTSAYQDKLAQAMAKAIQRYFEEQG